MKTLKKVLFFVNLTEESFKCPLIPDLITTFILMTIFKWPYSNGLLSFTH